MTPWMVVAIPIVCMFSLVAGLSRAEGSYWTTAACIATAATWAAIFYFEYKKARQKRGK